MKNIKYEIERQQILIGFEKYRHTLEIQYCYRDYTTFKLWYDIRSVCFCRIEDRIITPIFEELTKVIYEKTKQV